MKHSRLNKKKINKQKANKKGKKKRFEETLHQRICMDGKAHEEILKIISCQGNAN